MTEAPGGRGRVILDRALGGVLSFAMAAAVLVVLWQVFSRYVLAAPSSFSDELVRYLMIWIGILGAAYAAGQKMHLAIDLFPGEPGEPAFHRRGLFVQGAIATFAVLVMIVGGGRLVQLTLLLGQTSAALRIPLAWVYLVLPLAGLLILFYAALALLEHLRALRGARPSRLEGGS